VRREDLSSLDDRRIPTSPRWGEAPTFLPKRGRVKVLALEGNENNLAAWICGPGRLASQHIGQLPELIPRDNCDLARLCLCSKYRERLCINPLLTACCDEQYTNE